MDWMNTIDLLAYVFAGMFFGEKIVKLFKKKLNHKD